MVPTYYPATYWGGPVLSVYALNNRLAAQPGLVLRVLTTDAAGPGISDRLHFTAHPERYPPGYELYVLRRTAGVSISSALMGVRRSRRRACYTWLDSGPDADE